MMLVTIVAVPTEAETPSRTSWSPCTIHGWRPFSVSNQPEMFRMNGSGAIQTARRRNHRVRASVPRNSRNPASSANRSMSPPP